MPKKAGRKDTDSPDFETALQELEAIVADLERGDVTLEESLHQFERGIALTRACQAALKQAEQKVEILIEEHGKAATEPYGHDPQG